MPPAIAAVASWATAQIIAATAITSLAAAQAVWYAAYAAVSFAAYTGLNYALSAFGGKPTPLSQGQLVANTAPVTANRHVFGRMRVAGVMGWQGSFAWKDGDEENHGYGQVQVLSSTPITEVEQVLAADLELVGTVETYTGEAVALAANMEPYTKDQPAGQSRLYYRTDVGSAVGLRDPLMGWFADQSWQPLITSPNAAIGTPVRFYDVNARGDGLAKLSSAAYEDVVSFPQGPPRMSAVVKGVKVFDPRDPGQSADDPNTWNFSTNAALIAAWYVTRPFGFAVDYSDVDMELLILSANACDEMVQTFASTGAAGDPPMEPRYSCGGEAVEDDSRDQTLAAIVAAMAGGWCVSGNRWYFYAGVYMEPTVQVDDTWIMRNIEFTAQRSILQLFNTVNGSFMAEARRWQPAPFPQVQDPTILAADNGIEIVQTFDLAYVQSHTQAQRCMLIELRRTHKPRSLKFECPLGYAMRVIVGQTVGLTQADYGIDGVTFRVSSWEMMEQDDSGTIWVSIVLDEDGADIYEGDISDLTDMDGLSAPNPDPLPPDTSSSGGGETTDPPTGEGGSVIV